MNGNSNVSDVKIPPKRFRVISDMHTPRTAAEKFAADCRAGINIVDRVTSIYYKNRDARAKIVVNRGGARSSKSYSIAQLFLERFLRGDGRKSLVLRKTSPSLRITTLMLWTHLLSTWKVRGVVREERQSLNFFYKDSLVHFGSLDDPEKIKSSGWNDIWMEEANEFSFEDFMILFLRLSEPETSNLRNQIFLSLNPISQYLWIKTKLLDTMEDVTEIKSTYKDNPFLPFDYIRMLESTREQNVDYFKVYGEGEWGTLENLVYTNWDVVDRLPDNPDETIYGLDFGFNNPTALLRIDIKDGEYFEEQVIYRDGLITRDLIKKFGDLRISKMAPIYSDSAEPDRINEIFDAGYNIHPAEKSVKDGIDRVKSAKIHIVRSSTELIKEKQSYSWKKDKNSNILDEPVKMNDHLMDAERYAIYTHSGMMVPGLFFVGE